MFAWIMRNPNRIMGLIWPSYIWLKAVAAARLGWHFLPETDWFLTTVLTALGIAAVAKPNPKP